MLRELCVLYTSCMCINASRLVVASKVDLSLSHNSQAFYSFHSTIICTYSAAKRLQLHATLLLLLVSAMAWKSVYSRFWVIGLVSQSLSLQPLGRLALKIVQSQKYIYQNCMCILWLTVKPVVVVEMLIILTPTSTTATV